MRVKMLRTKIETVDGVDTTLVKGSSWNVSDAHGSALLADEQDDKQGPYAEPDPDLVHEAAESVRKDAIRARAGNAPKEVVDACVADPGCTPELASLKFAEFEPPVTVVETTSPAASTTSTSTEEA